MSRGFPSLTALLGLIAIAGYQNRDKIAEVLGNLNKSSAGHGAPGGGALNLPGGLGGLLGSLGGAGASGGVLGGALGELVDRFKQSGQGDVVDSWVGTGPNKDVSREQLEGALGPDMLSALSEKTGLSREELLARLSRDLPTAVDSYTPSGKLPEGAH